MLTRRVAVALATAMALFALTNQCAGAADTAEQPKVENSDNTASLAEPTKLTGQGMSFTIRPPKDYKMLTLPGSRGTMFLWHGPIRADGSSATLGVSPIVPPESSTKLTADEYVTGFLDTRSNKYVSNPEVKEVEINGRKFKCASFQKIKDDGKQYDGFVAATETRAGVVTVMSMDLTGHNDSLDAAWSSFRTITSIEPEK